MKNSTKSTTKKNIIIILLIVLFLYSVLKIGNSFASTDNFSLTHVEIISKSDTVQVNSINYENKKITNDITFHQVGDIVNYKITIANNNNEDYKLKSFNSTIDSEFITIENDNYEGTVLKSKQEKDFELKVKYSKEVNNIELRNQNFSVGLILTLESEKGETIEENIVIEPSSVSNNDTEKSLEKDLKENEPIVATYKNPKTGDNIYIYIFSSISSFVMLIIILKNNKVADNKGKHSNSGMKFFSLFLAIILVLPTISKATGEIEVNYAIEGTIRLMDKLLISFEVDGKTREIIANYGDIVEIENPSTKTGYDFDGWYTDPENGEKVDVNYKVTEDIALYAHFSPISYKINYNLDDGNASNPDSYTIEDTITLEKPLKTGYTFEGWTGSNGNEPQKNVIIEKGTTGEKTYNANYTQNSYEVTFDSKGGTEVTSIIKKYNEEIGVLPSTTKESYIFDGWYGDENYTEKIDQHTKVMNNKTYYAKWREPRNFELIFDANGGTIEQNSKVIVEGNAIGELPTPTRDEKIFMGWYTDTNYSTKINKYTIPEDSTTYYAKWNERMVTVFSLPGNVIFNGKDGFIEGDNVEKYSDKKYIDTGIKLFNEANYFRDFEIEFEIVEYSGENQDSNEEQQTFVNGKYELQSLNYPGFVFRRVKKDNNNVELTSRALPSGSGVTATFDSRNIKKYKIIRKNNVLQIIANDSETYLNQNLSTITTRFDVPVTFGASLDSNNNPFRLLKATLKNLSIKLEYTAEDYEE